MTPEQITEALASFESMPENLHRQLKEISEDKNLSVADREEKRRQLRADIRDRLFEAESQLAEAIQGRMQQVDLEITHEQRQFFERSYSEAGEDNQILVAVSRLEGHLRRADLRQRWSHMSGREMLSHYQETLALDDRPLIELYEAEAPRILNSRGDREGETSLRSAISQARKLRRTDRMESLQKTREKVEVQRLRLRNSLTNIQELMRTI